MLNDFWFRIDNGIISENMYEFGNFVHEYILEGKKKKSEAPMTLQSKPPLSSVPLIRSQAKDSQIGFLKQGESMVASQEQKEFSFIPPFLRKK
jgi:hypothetical protein